jgi:hypothetical protein
VAFGVGLPVSFAGFHYKQANVFLAKLLLLKICFGIKSKVGDKHLSIAASWLTFVHFPILQSAMRKAQLQRQFFHSEIFLQPFDPHMIRQTRRLQMPI